MDSWIDTNILGHSRCISKEQRNILQSNFQFSMQQKINTSPRSGAVNAGVLWSQGSRFESSSRHFWVVSHLSSKHTKENATLGGSKRHVWKKFKKRVISLCLEHPKFEIKGHGPNKSHPQNSKSYGGVILNVIFALTTVIQYSTEIFWVKKYIHALHIPCEV